MIFSSNSREFADEQAFASWKLLDNAIDVMYAKQALSLSFEELYRNAYYLVLHRYGEMAYTNVRKAIERNMKKYFEKLLKVPEENFLTQILEIWKDAKILLKMIRDIFLYMDKNYIMQNKLKPLTLVGYDLFKELFLNEETNMGRNYYKKLMSLIKRDWNGEQINRMLIKSCSKMLLEVGMTISVFKGHQSYSNQNSEKEVYTEKFERILLQEATEFYKHDSDKNIKTSNCPEFLKYLEDTIQNERERALVLFDKQSEPKLINIIIKHCLEDNCEFLVNCNSGLEYLLDENRKDDLIRLNNLFSYSKTSTNYLMEKLPDIILKKGKKILEDSNLDPIGKMKAIHDLVSQMYSVVISCFPNIQIQLAMKNGFKKFINEEKNFIMMFNLYLDFCFKQDFKSLNDDSVNKKLDISIKVFKNINDKDLLEESYRNLLAKRLVNDKIISNDYEKIFIMKLKQECGSYFTLKLENMFIDISASTELIKEFYEKKDLLRNLSVKVLSSGTWNYQSDPNSNYPEQMAYLLSHFTSFYFGKHPERKLLWLNNLGNATLKVNFNGKKKELVVSTIQMIILLLFKTKNSLTYHEMIAKTNIESMELSRNLLSLTDMDILKRNTKEESNSPFANSDIIEFNEGFSHKSYKIKIPVKKSPKDNLDFKSKDPDSMKSERKLVIEAFIIRIMKSRKKIEHSQLMEEIMSLSKNFSFIPTVSLIKMSIENLIERQYIERLGDMNTYSYIS